MSRRLLRVLIALYPRRWRRRYGLELEHLVDELAAARDASRVRLAIGLIGGACLERIRLLCTWGASATIVAIGAAGATLVVSAINSSHATAPRSTELALKPATATSPASTSQSATPNTRGAPEMTMPLTQKDRRAATPRRSLPAPHPILKPATVRRTTTPQRVLHLPLAPTATATPSPQLPSQPTVTPSPSPPPPSSPTPVA